MTDRVDLRGLRVRAHHGVFEHERQDGQEFVVDVTVWADLSTAGASDALDDTIDYGTLALTVRDLVASERWDLIERVATRVSEVVLSLDGRIERVEVTVHKPQAPIPTEFDDVAVTIARAR